MKQQCPVLAFHLLEYVTLGCTATPSASNFHPDFLHDVPFFKEIHLPSLVLADFV